MFIGMTLGVIVLIVFAVALISRSSGDALGSTTAAAWSGISDVHSKFWLWIERISWAAVVVGFPIGIYQVIMLRNEQRRVAHELVQRPEILVGFYPLTESRGKKTLKSEAEIVGTWQPGQTLSDPVDFTIVCYNAGEGTARNALYNFKFPTEFGYLTKIGVAPKQGRFLDSPEDGRPLWVIGGDEHIHPEVSSVFTTAIRIPQKMPTIPIAAEISMDDRPGVNAMLMLRVVVHPSNLRKSIPRPASP